MPDRARRNPYLLTLLVLWIVAASLGLLMIAASQMEVGTGMLIFAGIAALLHLAVKAVRWHPTD